MRGKFPRAKHEKELKSRAVSKGWTPWFFQTLVEGEERKVQVVGLSMLGV